jgi:hypothetical protein
VRAETPDNQPWPFAGNSAIRPARLATPNRLPAAPTISRIFHPQFAGLAQR